MTIKEALEALRKEYGCRTAKDRDCFSFGSTCDGCEHYVDADTITEAIRTVLDNFPTQMSGTSKSG